MGRALARQVVSLKANLQYGASGGELKQLRLKRPMLFDIESKSLSDTISINIEPLE